MMAITFGLCLTLFISFKEDLGSLYPAGGYSEKKPAIDLLIVAFSGEGLSLNQVGERRTS